MQEAAIRACSRCGETRPIEDFPWKNRDRGLRRSWCRSCQRAYSHEHYLANLTKYTAKARKNERRGRLQRRELIDDYLRVHPCVDCGESLIELLEFDHRNPQRKRDTVNRLVTICSWKIVQAEIEKCDVRCANCHRQRTAAQFGWAKTKPLAKPEPRPVAKTVARIDAQDADFLRECIWCHWLRPLSEFSFRSASAKTLNSHCRKCHAAYRRDHYIRNRDRYFSQAIAQARRRRSENLASLRDYLLDHPCVDCGMKSVASLEFDHVDPTTKTSTISAMLPRSTWASIQREIAKCAVRCANCHRRRTLEQRSELAGSPTIGVRAGVAQLAERRLPKPKVAESFSVSRSTFSRPRPPVG
jgi:hypothetical protein